MESMRINATGSVNPLTCNPQEMADYIWSSLNNLVCIEEFDTRLDADGKEFIGCSRHYDRDRYIDTNLNWLAPSKFWPSEVKFLHMEGLIKEAYYAMINILLCSTGKSCVNKCVGQWHTTGYRYFLEPNMEEIMSDTDTVERLLRLMDKMGIKIEFEKFSQFDAPTYEWVGAVYPIIRG